MKTSSAVSSRLVVCSATLAVLTAGIGSGSDRAGAKSEQEPPENPSIQFEARIERLVRDWFAVLEDPTADAKALSDLLTEAPFELLLEEEALHDRDALLSWVSRLRATYPEMEYRIDPIHVQSDVQGRQRVHFEFDRHALDDAGFPHVARREHTWIVQSNADAMPVILKIEERPLLYFPGTGPQIICY